MNAVNIQHSTFNIQLSGGKRTHPITAGTRNITLNVPESEASFWERLTDQLGFRSRNACLAHFLGLGLRTLSEEKQLEWALIRRRFFNGAGSGALLLVVLAMLMLDLAGERSGRAARGRKGQTSRTVARRGRCEAEEMELFDVYHEV